MIKFPGKIILLLLLSFMLQAESSAAEKTNFNQKVIGSTFKSLARAFVAVSDIDKLKANNIRRLEKLNDTKFKKQLAKVYPVLQDLPQTLKAQYGVKEDMSREQVIKNIESLDKKKIYGIIEAVPDATITRLFKEELVKTKEGIMKSDAVGSVKKFWNKIIRKAN
ncbi:MAG: hypothetical protein MUC39_00490 [Candidatus Omnitrophica bacterium]|jgi:hypothetical protein|nr:hypothetical protein [Candidatus Omnitrophota bacterium]